jgi:HEPN domain-containing protein
MDDAKRELVRGWLTKARNDLDTVRQIAGLPDGHLDVAIYHCQQAAEKALKGFLAYHDHPLERTHDLKRLVGLAAHHDATFAGLMEDAAAVTPYATAYRYPGELAIIEPSREEFDEAVVAATRLTSFVCSRLPADVQAS